MIELLKSVDLKIALAILNMAALLLVSGCWCSRFLKDIIFKAVLLILGLSNGIWLFYQLGYIVRM